MTPAEVQERMRLLELKRNEYLAEINRLGAELGRVEGAIQDCQFWIARLTETAPATG